MKNKKGFSTIVIIAIVAILIAIGIFMVVKKGTNFNIYNKQGPQVTQTQQPQASPIQNSSDLNVTSADLDNTYLDGIDAELNQIDADASTF